MLKTLHLISFIFLLNILVAQTGNVGIGTSSPDASAILDVSSTNKGLLIPRVSLSNATTFGLAGATATAGMMVYNTNASITGGYGVGFYYWSTAGGPWTRVANGNLPATLSNGKIWIGNASNNPVEQTMSGDATISNTGVLDLSNQAVETSEIADNAVDGTKINITSNANGDLMYYNGTDWVRLASGTTGYILQTTTGAAPTWVSATKNIKAQNGLSIATTAPTATASEPYVELGGTLVRPTTITQGSNAFTIANNGTTNTTINLSSTGNFDVQDNGTSALFVRDDGNVGINNNAPTAKLHILVPADANNAPASNGIYVYNTGNSGDNDDAIITTRVNGANAGDPFFSMDVDGVTGWSIGIDNSDADKLKFANQWDDPGTNTRMTITTAGDVGIGTTAPNTKLDVVGILAMNDYAIRLRPGTDANHQIIFNSTVDGPSIEGCSGIQFKKNCTAEVLGTWNTTALDVQNSQIYAREGIKTRKNYKMFQRYRTPSADRATDNLGTWDFCALAASTYFMDYSTDFDTDIQCNVYPNESGISSSDAADFNVSFSKDYASKPTWTLYSENIDGGQRLTCAAICINFE